MAKPIVFSPYMVRAILEGRKTVTRRMIKYFPDCFESPIIENFKGDWYCYDSEYPDEGAIKINQPYKIKNILWVKEEWSSTPDGHIHYRATDEALGPWKPSVFMPRSIPRINLMVVDVRAEKLKDITKEDIAKEGFEMLPQHPDLMAPFWNKVYGRKYSWDSDLWVWRIEFRMAE